MYRRAHTDPAPRVPQLTDASQLEVEKSQTKFRRKAAATTGTGAAQKGSLGSSLYLMPVYYSWS